MSLLEELLPGATQRLKDAAAKDRSSRHLATATAQSALERRAMPSLLRSNPDKYPRTRHAAQQTVRDHGQR